jgi:hypothetical protein
MRFTEIISEAGSPAQQAAKAIAMKKAGKKPKNVSENDTAAGINKMFNNLGDPVFSNLQRVALLAMQGRQQEASGRLQSVIKDASPAVQKKIIDAVNSIKPVTINGKIADSSTIDKSKQHQDWIINTFIPWVQSLLGQQGVAEGENWSKHNNKRVGGMSKKSVSVYRREHPGSKIQTAVTTKPSKLKKGSKAAKRRASFCARMRGMKKHRTSAKTAHDPNSNINKSLRRWHCESIEELHELVMLAEQYIRNNKK